MNGIKAGYRTKIRIVLASALVLLIMNGCSNSKDNTVSDTASPDATKPATMKPKSKISVSVYDRGNVPAAEGTIDNNRWSKWINANGPANVEFVPIPRWESLPKLNTLFASGSAPDLIFEFDAKIRNQFLAQKQFMPIDDLVSKSVEYKKFLEQNPGVKKLAMNEDGKMHYFGRVVGPTLNVGLVIREDWLENLGLKSPTTPEELLAVAKAFTERDPDGNGKKDTFGYHLSFIGGGVIDRMYNSGEIPDGMLLNNGELVRQWDNSKAALQLKKQLFDAGTVDKDFLTDKGEKALQDFVNGKLGIYGINNIAGVNGAGYKNFETLRKNNPNAKIKFIPFPTTLYGSYSWGWEPIQLVAAVNAKAKNPQAVMDYMDFLTKDSTQLSLTYGIENEHWKMGEDGCPKQIDPAKSKAELDYNGDLRMQANIGIGLLAKCAQPEKVFDAKVPLQKEFMDLLLQQAKPAYLNPERPFNGFTASGYNPALPQDLSAFSATLTQSISDIFNKAIVSGASYSVDQAINDAKTAWSKGNGDKIEAWYKDWYAKNKDKIYTTAEIYKQYVK
ncbi:extracellular solute-binding protein [Paenibacillus sp. LMG 31458]|uniref:Extracellular solute-binding protein n=1 Tax=Paenibacillus phytorum TaxID=2654977 RepID=A0ABX1Y9L6_9BACL|nr:extracellular solute-binding protein [Paenibacillus phytorum]NOU76911.1 extracellular solute-binding protein [Paenibacillus phytorum]